MKTGESFNVALSKQAASILRRRMQMELPGGWVFSYGNGSRSINPST